MRVGTQGTWDTNERNENTNCYKLKYKNFKHMQTAKNVHLVMSWKENGGKIVTNANKKYTHQKEQKKKHCMKMTRYAEKLPQIIETQNEIM